MRLFTALIIPKKENCDICRVKTNQKKAFKKNLLDNLFKEVLRQKSDYVLTDLSHSKKKGLESL